MGKGKTKKVTNIQKETKIKKNKDEKSVSKKKHWRKKVTKMKK